jgi:hypothetical protein
MTSSLPDNRSGVSTDDRTGWDLTTHNSTESNNSPCTNHSPRCKNSFGGNPSLVCHRDCAQSQIKSRLAVIMISRAKIHPLRKADMIADLNRGKIVDPQHLAKPTVIAYI